MCSSSTLDAHLMKFKTKWKGKGNPQTNRRSDVPFLCVCVGKERRKEGTPDRRLPTNLLLNNRGLLLRVEDTADLKQ